MVGHAPLGKVVGTDFLGTVSRTNLALTKLCFCIMCLLLFHIIQLRPQQRKSLCLVLQLRLLRLAVYHNSCGVVRQTDSRVGSIDTLPTIAGGTHHVDADILFIDLHIHFLRLRHHRNGNGRSMDTSAGFRLRNPLYTMHTAFVFHYRVGSLPGNHKGYTLHSSDTNFLHLHGFHLPAAAFRIMHIHTINFCRKQGRFISAGTGADFHNNVFIIIRVLRQKKNLHGFFQLFHPLFGITQLFLQHLSHVLVGFHFQHGKAVFNVLLTFFVFSISLHNRSQFALLLHQLTETLLIISHRRLMQLTHNFFITNQQIVQFIKHGYPP